MTRIAPGLRNAVLLAALMAGSAPATATAQQPEQVRGTVTLRDGGAAAGVPVVLEIDNGQSVVQRLDGVTDDSGQVVFTGVRGVDSNVVRMGATFDGATYYSDPVLLGSGVRDLAVTVAEVTGEGHPLHLDTLHVIVQVDEPTRYQVLEFATVSNAGEAAWAGGPSLGDGTPAGLEIPLPEGASEVRPAPFPSAEDAIPEEAMEISPGRVLDPRPVPPSGRQVALTYVLEGADDGADLRLVLPYPTASVSVLVGGSAVGAVDFESTNLVHSDPQQIGEQQYEMWAGQSLAPGAEVVLSIAPHHALMTPISWALVGLGLALGLVVLVSFRRLRPGPDQEDLREELLQRIARLDLEREAGELDDVEYQRRRGEEVERLLVVQSRLEGRSQPDREPDTVDE